MARASLIYTQSTGFICTIWKFTFRYPSDCVVDKISAYLALRGITYIVVHHTSRGIQVASGWTVIEVDHGCQRSMSLTWHGNVSDLSHGPGPAWTCTQRARTTRRTVHRNSCSHPRAGRFQGSAGRDTSRCSWFCLDFSESGICNVSANQTLIQSVNERELSTSVKLSRIELRN